MDNNTGTGTSDLFVILGTAQNQRFEIVWQMAEYLIFNGEQVEVCLHTEETPPESPALTRLQGKSDRFSLTTWSLREDSCDFNEPPKAKPNTVTLFLGHGQKFLVDTLETLAYWLPTSNFTLQRITSWVDCELVGQKKSAQKWYECCYYFSDLVLLDRFKTLPVSWLKEYQSFFKKECYPCIIENTKKGRIHDLFLAMDNQPRRIAQVFEKPDDLFGDFIDDEDDEDMEEDTVPDTSSPEKEPYFERLVDGRRSKLVPDPF